MQLMEQDLNYNIYSTCKTDTKLPINSCSFIKNVTNNYSIELQYDIEVTCN